MIFNKLLHFCTCAVPGFTLLGGKRLMCSTRHWRLCATRHIIHIHYIISVPHSNVYYNDHDNDESNNAPLIVRHVGDLQPANNKANMDQLIDTLIVMMWVIHQLPLWANWVTLKGMVNPCSSPWLIEQRWKMLTAQDRLERVLTWHRRSDERLEGEYSVGSNAITPLKFKLVVITQAGPGVRAQAEMDGQDVPFDEKFTIVSARRLCSPSTDETSMAMMRSGAVDVVGWYITSDDAVHSVHICAAHHCSCLNIHFLWTIPPRPLHGVKTLPSLLPSA